MFGGGEGSAGQTQSSSSSNNSNDVLSLLFSPSPSSTGPSSSQPSQNQDSQKDGGGGTDFAGLFDAAPGGRFSGGGAGALRLDADGKLVMSADALAEEEDVAAERPVCTYVRWKFFSFTSIQAKTRHFSRVPKECF